MTDHDDTGTPNEANIKALREKAERADAAAAKVVELERKLALRDSNLDPQHPSFALFEKGYDGEWDVDSLNKAGEQYGLLKQESDVSGQQTTPTPPAGGMEFTDAQVQWLKEQQFPAAQGMQPAGDIFGQQATAQQRMEAAQAGGQVQDPGTLSNDDWKTAATPEEFMARYRQAGGAVTSD